MQLRNHSAIVGLAAVLALALAGPVSAQNVLTNPGFETGDLTGWQVFGQSANSDVFVESPDNGPSAPGTFNAFMDNSAEAVGLTLKQTTAVGSVEPGTVDWSVDLKLDQADAGGVLFFEVFAEQEGVGIIGGSGLQGPFFPFNAWETFSGSFEAPTGTNFLSVQIMANTGANPGTNCRARVDNVVLDAPQPVSVDSESWSGVKSQYR